MQVFAWEDLDDDNDVLTEYRTYEGHREDITHMAGVYSRIGLGLGFRLGVGTAPPHGRCETKYDSPGSCLSRPQSERIYSHWCAAYAGRQLLATADCEHTSTPPPPQGPKFTPSCAAYASRQLLATGDYKHTSTPPPSHWCAAYANRQLLATGDYEGRITIWNIFTGEKRMCLFHR